MVNVADSSDSTHVVWTEIRSSGRSEDCPAPDPGDHSVEFVVPVLVLDGMVEVLP